MKWWFCVTASIRVCVYAVVKLVLWSGGLTWRSQVGANRIPIPQPNNLALFGHKMALYRFSHVGARTVARGGAQIRAGAVPPAPLTLNTVCICVSVIVAALHSTEFCPIHIVCRGTGVSGLMRGLATLPQGGSWSLRWSEIRMEDPKRTLWQCTASVCVAGVYCWEISFG